MYNSLAAEDIVLSAESVSTPVWSGNVSTLTSIATSSNQNTYSRAYYLDVYSGSYTTSSEVQFSVAYADKRGSGSVAYNTAVPAMSPSRTIYGQYRTFALGDEDSDFKFNGDTVSQNFWVISVDRARYKEKLKPGSLQLQLSGSSVKTFVDAGILNDKKVVSYVDSGRVYDIFLSASSVDTGSSYGYFLPDIGTILLDCAQISSSCGLVPVTGSSTAGTTTNTENQNKIFSAIKSFTLQAEETVSSTYVFVRAKNAEFNYSMNPSFLTGSGEVKIPVMVNAPETYITTVGLYNDNADLLAVAKLSRPLLKNFTKEALIRIKLDY
jgi:hypothetical protein